ncbi:hypothetical protein GW17_00019230 [Ensete ventricosum]|nr:hypothetical protein GW17_00019230 [Ensete ventricosum]
MGGTYWFTNRAICGPSTTRRYHGFSPLRQGKKQQKEGEEEEESQTLLPSNSEAIARLSKTSMIGEPRDDAADENLTRWGLLATVFSSSKATRKRGKHQRLLLTRTGRRSLDDFLSARGEENVTSSTRAGRRKRSDIVLFFHF